MAMRSTSLTKNTSTGISRDIASQYDNVKIVAENIQKVIDLATTIEGNPEAFADVASIATQITTVAGIAAQIVSVYDSKETIETISPYMAEVENVAAAVTSGWLESVYDNIAGLEVIATDLQLGGIVAITDYGYITDGVDTEGAGESVLRNIDANINELLLVDYNTTEAANSAVYAEEWANKDEDVLVSMEAGGDGVDDYSSMHWAKKAEADAVLTAADVVTTNADVVMTNADRVITNADAVQTGLDRVATGNDVAATAQDVLDTAADLALTNADVVLTHADVVNTNADVVTTGNNVTEAQAAQGLAEDARDAAAISETNAEAAWDSLDDRYLGMKVVEPTADNDGDALVEGALYWNSTDKQLYVWDSLNWVDATFGINEVVTSFNTRKGDVVLTNADVTAAVGIDVSAVEAGATADQTASEIEALYEGLTDTNKYTDDEKAEVAASTAHLADVTNPHEVTQSQVGLGQVDNTSDVDKPVSTLQEARIVQAEGNALAFSIALG